MAYSPLLFLERGVSVSKNFDTLLKNACIFERGCRPSRAWPKGPHTYGLRRVFSDVHAAGKHDLSLFRRLRTAELCEALASKIAEIHFIDSLTPSLIFLEREVKFYKKRLAKTIRVWHNDHRSSGKNKIVPEWDNAVERRETA
ncbi:hypothetical protein [Pseudoflavonifractor sp. MCC625]|uniref:hypothetical protein n=1 Tax=Pseudoflavonifractor sp. MCC625 TaxID=2592647 RepID=UPI001C02ECD0|nr:hypothetical protein [Pseudoflavonifractor sp. MCC625]MBT9683568.1 hypothetical protein [Pseudoflavonifractor sp. MCC625]